MSQITTLLRKKMINIEFIRSILAFLIIFNPIYSFAQPDLTACQECHGQDGNSNVDNWPKIAGLPKSYIIKQLKEYRKGKDGNRFEPSMYAIAKDLTDKQITDYADFYSEQTTTIGSVPQNFVELGQQIYRGGLLSKGISACAACHGANGKGNFLADFPPLSGQNSGYVASQLKKYATKERSTDQNSIMRDISSKLTNEEIEAVSKYVAGLH